MWETIVKTVYLNGPGVYVNQSQIGTMTTHIQSGNRWTVHLMWKVTSIQYHWIGSDQEEFWNVKPSKELPQDSDWDLYDTQEDKNDSDLE